MSLEREKLSRPVRSRRDEGAVASSAGESDELDPGDGSTDDSANDTDKSGENVSKYSGTQLMNAYKM